MKTKKYIFDLLFPIHCLSCGKEEEFICPDCLGGIPMADTDFEKIDQTDLQKLIIASYYENPVLKQAIYKHKYDFVKDLARPLGQVMIKKLINHNIRNAILIPVPLHKKRLRWRGFNQAELLAREISTALDIPLINNLLIRKKYTRPQMRIRNSQARQKNIKEAFALTFKVRPFQLERSDLEQRLEWQQFCLSIQNKTVILVDDICTTGATLNECAKILRPLKPKNIYGLVLARR